MNSDTAMQIYTPGTSLTISHILYMCMRVILLYALQVGPFSGGRNPCDLHTAQHGHRPALYPSLLHADKWDPFFCVWVEALSEGGLAPYHAQPAVQRHQAHPILCREQQRDKIYFNKKVKLKIMCLFAHTVKSRHLILNKSQISLSFLFVFCD